MCILGEVGRGVGGAVAGACGERLARLAGAGKQLLAVTHSPQVAAKGAAHFVIAKSSEGTVTRTGVRALDPAGRREEIARRSEEHTSELQSLMRISYAVFCLKKKNTLLLRSTHASITTHNPKHRTHTHT